MTHFSVGMHRRFQASPDIPPGTPCSGGNRAQQPENLVKAMMWGEGTAGHGLVSCKPATRTGRPGSYFQVRFSIR